jgi:lysozyme family protein
MMNFDLAFIFTIGNEGGFTNDPRDPGGPTKFGITLRSYEEYLKRLVTTAEIAALDIGQAKSFYLDTVWNPLCQKIESAAVGICIFDCAILYGPGTSVIMAQKTASTLSGAALKFDGIIGDQTLGILNKLKDLDFLQTYHGFVLERINKVIENNPVEEAFRKGWTSRADRLLTLTNLTDLIEETTKQEGGS